LSLRSTSWMSPSKSKIPSSRHLIKGRSSKRRRFKCNRRCNKTWIRQAKRKYRRA
jgi:hypothetical protein